ncbi:MAG: PhoU domain-containing protein [Christensenellales bacterium]|nr:PhoU domain-containing protein [Christensenellales bacterium]
MRSKFDEQLELLNVELIKMGSLCEDAISSAVRALLENDRKLAQDVFLIDGEIDQMERDIESLCMKLLLQQQPVASDLRLISSAIKMISDMERIGDQASDIAEISEFISVNEDDKRLIGDMSNAAIRDGYAEHRFIR